MIYLSKLPHSNKEFYLRILKNINAPSFELDEKKTPVFLSAKNGEVTNSNKTDVLKVWIKSKKEIYPSVISPLKVVISKDLNPAKKVMVQLIDSVTNQLYKIQKIRYANVSIECYLDGWPEEPNEEKTQTKKLL